MTPPLGGCQFLVMLLIWSLPLLVLCGRLLLMVLLMRFFWVSGFRSRTEENLTKQKNSSTPRGIHGSISSTSLEEVASCGAFQCFYS